MKQSLSLKNIYQIITPNMNTKDIEEMAETFVNSLEPIWTEADAWETENGYPPMVASRDLAKQTFIKTFTQHHQAELERARADERAKVTEEIRRDLLAEAQRERADFEAIRAEIGRITPTTIDRQTEV